MKINELPVEVKKWALSYYLDNEIGSDEYRDVQPASGLNAAGSFFEIASSMTQGLNPATDIEMLKEIRTWIDAIIEESKSITSSTTESGMKIASDMYPGVDHLEPVLTRFFNATWDAGINPVPHYWEQPEDILAAYNGEDARSKS